MEARSINWDREADVVVVGYGFAGEISSIFGHLYLEAGNITECFIGGRIADKNAVEESPWA